MATQPTNLPVPSESPRDLKFNAGKIDEFVTSMGWTYTDRFGQKHYTIEGINYLSQQAMAAYGYVILTGKTFTTGATLNNPNEVLLNTADGEYYKWTGSFASGGKVVPANSTPAGTGGIGPGAWIGVGDASLRAALAAPGGVNLVNGAAKQSDLDALSALLESRNYVKYPMCAEFSKRLADGVTFSIDCFGDSTMWGATSNDVEVKDLNNPPAVLKTTISNLYNIEVTVNNRAISGTTMAQMLAGTDGSGMTFEQRISGTSASVIYCNHCINDSQLNNDLNTYRLNVAEFVRICRKYNKVPVLVTANINPATNLDGQAAIIGETKSKRLEKYVNVMREVATDLSVDLVDQYHYYQRTARMIAPIDLVPDGAHPSSDAYSMSGRNLAIPLCNAKPLEKAWDKQGLANATYFDNIGATKQYRTTYTPFKRFGGVIVGTRQTSSTGLNMAVLLENPTDDTVLAMYGTQWNSGTLSSFTDNGIATNQFGGVVEQGNGNLATIDWEAVYLPSKCQLYAGLHVIGIVTNTSMGGTGTDFAICGYGLVPRVEANSANDINGKISYNYVPFMPSTELSTTLNLFATGNALSLRAASDGTALLTLGYTLNGALTVTRAGESAVTIGSTISPACYNCRIRYMPDKTIIISVGTLSTTLTATSAPLPNMYVHGIGQPYVIRAINS